LDWEPLIRGRIFQPLGMRGARCTSPPADADRASPHRPDRSGTLRVSPWYEQPRPDPAGSIHASADDLVPWLQFQLGDGTWRGRRLLSAEGLRELQTPQIALRLEGLHRAAAPDTLLMSYGLGWVVHDYRGQLVVSHAGAIDGFRSQITLLPNAGLGFALLCNRHQTRMNLALTNLLIDRLLGLPPRDWHAYYRNFARQEEELLAAAQNRSGNGAARPKRPASDLVGRYSHPAYGDIAISLENGAAVFHWSGFRGTIRNLGGDEFAIDDDNLTENTLRPIVAGNRVVALEFLNLRFDRQ
jgi:CubicO group peptidase (beta-lactamase class C family)